ncbi:hypothetical protein B0T25DRAFT_523766 [Lasiosphaeria hispida]|uniref:Uncharacterized protein n=1 Tax=Lasiosphaeria hispida TaxID=260671 RepID=A0AAJ0HT61_9PEZI|nr:hypothetical protein B0T25DRAFT_523766 [Lasiosphaeria hispida]
MQVAVSLALEHWCVPWALQATGACIHVCPYTPLALSLRAWLSPPSPFLTPGRKVPETMAYAWLFSRRGEGGPSLGVALLKTLVCNATVSRFRISKGWCGGSQEQVQERR